MDVVGEVVVLMAAVGEGRCHERRASRAQRRWNGRSDVLQCGAACCKMLQCVSVCCSEESVEGAA